MEKTKLVYTTYIRTTPKKVWAAIIKPKFTRQYWGGGRNVSDWKPGSTWEGRSPGNDVWITGKILKSNPPKSLVVSWAAPTNLADKSRVTFEIEAVGDMTCLTVTHDNFKAGSAMVKNVSGGWPRVLSSLKSFLETGTGLDIFCRN